MAKDNFLIKSILGDKKPNQQDQNTLKNAVLPIFSARDLKDYVLSVEVLKPKAGHGIILKPSQVRALAKVYLSDTDAYLSSLSKSDTIPAAPQGFLNKHSDFQQVMIDTAFDLSADLGVMFTQLHSRLTENDLQKILENPKALETSISMKKLGLGNFVDNNDFEETAERLWEFSTLSGGPMVFTLACIRHAHGGESDAYKSSVEIMKGWLDSRRQAFEILACGDLLVHYKQSLSFPADQAPSWDDLEEKAATMVGRLSGKMKKRLNL